ncbi:CocE/NonD family hydrolase [Xanthomonas translucens]|uniref:CocE/NonD family hydrolase n=1 Tax=Xanthomonas campestris pv. translucens TaxID=343 RepID=UPI000642786E|nr:CocE/NonD family hydrolase [Xanthomonas translucens]AKK68890.1 X-Pro dipeptidyl-peptidase [Xanthomonas translucens pv. undulosa]MCT8270968.1 X-Pro dipeptidyl-peptidase [Xanthomonas translucens pv. undulosa]WNJ32196.1 CocE/NonD family hydrolase [Xanthomonas translucens pv. undulosa]
MRTSVSRCIALCAMLLFSTAAFAGGFSNQYRTIASWDGTKLGALVLVPQGQGPGPFPLVVMPASWSLPNLEYVGRASELASDGYVVVSYTSRGFWDSAGQIDIAGAATVEDVSSVIDWALANTPANAKAIGVSGISYGAGTSLLAAARDPRIKAVAALSGWADLQASLYANATVSQQSVGLLVASGAITGRPGPDLAQISARVAGGDYDGAVQGFLPKTGERGVINEVQALNRNGTAVLLANAFNDGLFPPNQYIDLYNRLSVPKHLMFSQGDHATAELPGALGLPNEIYTETTRWFDHYLKGQANGVDSEQPVQLATLNGTWLRYADWNSVQAGATRYALTRPSGLIATGALTTGTSTGWSKGIATGVPTLADSGVLLVSGLLQGLGQPVSTSIPLLDRNGAAVWSGPVLRSAKRLAGSPSLRVTVTPSQANVSLFAYLYSMNGLGVAQLLSHAPYSLRNAPPGVATTIDLPLQATAAEIPAGNRLVLVVGTTDPRYTSASRFGGSVSFSSPASAPSTLSVPLH